MVNEIRDLESNPSFYTGTGATVGSNHKKRDFKKAGASIVLGCLGGLAMFALFFGAENFIPDSIGHALVSSTDTQCANGTIDKEWAFIEIMRQGQIPSDTIANLKERNVLVGTVDENQVFTESANGTVLKKGDKIITASTAYDEFQNDAELYNALDKATYSCAAYYYDDTAKQAFAELGTNRNNFIEGSDFNEVLDSATAGSDVSINSVAYVQKTRVVNGKTETYYEYETAGKDASSKSSAADLIEDTRKNHPASTTAEAALNTADALKIADTASKEQRSASFFLLFMENIDKMKAGEGNSAKINEAMNFLHTSATTETVDTETGETITVTGSPLESPSLSAILNGKTVSATETKNYSSDRVLQTVENRLNLSTAANSAVKNLAATSITESVASFANGIRGTISHFLKSAVTTAESAIFTPLVSIISGSLIDNSYSQAIKGIAGGELLVEGAVNVANKLATAGGATAADSTAVMAYNSEVTRIAKLNDQIDGMNRSPFDITSKNTFFGAIAHNLLPLFTHTSNISLSILPSATAATNENFLTSFGECETYATIHAVGTVHCSKITTFDTSTQNDPYNNPEFINFVNKNTYLNSNGERVVKENSDLAKFILYNDRQTPLGTIDAGILYSLEHNDSFVSFIPDQKTTIELLRNATPEQKAIASGAAFVNSAENPYWEKYKYAQRYVSIARAVAVLKQYSSDATAYTTLTMFEGKNNPVVAFLNNHNNIANR